MLEVLSGLLQNLIKKSISKEFEWDSSTGDSENARKRLSQEESEESSNILKKKGTKTTINSIFKKSQREDAYIKKLLYFSTTMLFHLMWQRAKSSRGLSWLPIMVSDLSHHHTIRLRCEIFEATGLRRPI